MCPPGSHTSAGPVRLRVGGTIDMAHLCRGHLADLHAATAPFFNSEIDAPLSSSSGLLRRESTENIRSWARANGYPVAVHGSLPHAVLHAYRQEHLPAQDTWGKMAIRLGEIIGDNALAAG
jgi:hypothetical protein